MSVFSARLRRLASSCDFGADLQRRLSDQLVSGIRSAETRKKLLQKDQDFNDSLAIALADEAESGQLSTSSGDVHHVKHKHQRHAYPSKEQNPSKKSAANSYTNPTANSSKSYKCFLCGSTAHHCDKCKF